MPKIGWYFGKVGHNFYYTFKNRLKLAARNRKKISLGGINPEH